MLFAPQPTANTESMNTRAIPPNCFTIVTSLWCRIVPSAVVFQYLPEEGRGARGALPADRCNVRASRPPPPSIHQFTNSPIHQFTNSPIHQFTNSPIILNDSPRGSVN